MTAAEEALEEQKVINGKAFISSTTIWNILGMLATYFGPKLLEWWTANPDAFSAYMSPTLYAVIQAVLMVLFGAGAVKGRVSADKPITSLVYVKK